MPLALHPFRPRLVDALKGYVPVLLVGLFADATRGYAAFDYDFLEYRPNRLVKLVEDLMERFPHVPREAVFKEDLLRGGVAFDPSALSDNVWEMVIDWLAAGPHASDVAAIRKAHRRHGGEGALYLVLKRRR
mgnify:CR=1 FL=1